MSDLRDDVRREHLPNSRGPWNVTEPRDEREAVLEDCYALRRRTIRKLAQLGLRHERRQLEKLSQSGSLASATISVGRFDPVASKELQTELFALRERADALRRKSTRLRLTERFGPHIHLRAGNLDEYHRIWTDTDAANQLPRFMSSGPLPPLWGPPPSKGRPSSEEPWAATFPRIYWRFGARAPLDLVYFSTTGPIPLGANKPSRRQVLRAWGRFLAMVGHLGSHRDEIRNHAREIARMAKDGLLRNPETGRSPQDGGRRCAVDAAYFRIARLPGSVTLKAAAIESFLGGPQSFPGF